MLQSICDIDCIETLGDKSKTQTAMIHSDSRDVANLDNTRPLGTDCVHDSMTEWKAMDKTESKITAEEILPKHHIPKNCNTTDGGTKPFTDTHSSQSRYGHEICAQGREVYGLLIRREIC